MFTKSEALSFLKNNLAILNAEERLTNDRKILLDEFVIQMQTCLLFQNLRLLSEAPEKRHRPSLEEIKVDLVSGLGGLCYNINVSAYFLLKALGFKATLGHATCTSSVAFTNNHVVVYVVDVEKEGDKYLVEVAVGFPTFRAICLDFEVESPIYVDSFLEYKYIRYEGKIARMQRRGDPVRRSDTSSWEGINFVLDGWRRFYYADPVETGEIEDFYQSFDEVFTNAKASPFHLTYRVLGFPNKKAIAIVNSRFLKENDAGELVPEDMAGDEGILEAVKHYFPVIPEELARKALASWRQSSES